MLLESLLKNWTGRTLSKEQMDAAQPPTDEDNVIILCHGSPLNIDRLRKLPDGRFVRFQQDFEYMTTPDVSHGWSISHTGYYPTKTERKVYNPEGLLIERCASRGNLYIGTENLVDKVYDPPGSWIGKKRKDN
ncbi:MAG: hypothetical protein AABX72_00130 [Nanoarchaeota archaeon]